MILDPTQTYASYVNLDQRTDRRERMERAAADAGLTVTRTRGILPSEFTGDPARVQRMQARTPGAIGCYLSQLEVMREAARRGQNALVLEDDLVFCRDFAARAATIDDFLNGRPWDVFWLGGTFHVNPPVWHPELGRDVQLTDNPRIVRTYGCWSTYAYAVNGARVEQILTLLEDEMVNSIGIDTTFIELQPRLQTFAYVPGCIKQYDNYGNVGEGMTYFSGFATLGPYWWQDRAEDFDPATFDWAEAGAR